MGNGASCVSTRQVAAKLIDPKGTVRSVECPVGVAEIMMDFPGHAVARADEIARTRRAAGMQADEDLRPGLAYLLLPLDRLGSRLSDKQMEVLLDAVRGRRRHSGRDREGVCGGGKRVFPEVAGAQQGKLEVVGGFPGKLISGCRQWRPALDTIHESKSN